MSIEKEAIIAGEDALSRLQTISKGNSYAATAVQVAALESVIRLGLMAKDNETRRYNDETNRKLMYMMEKAEAARVAEKAGEAEAAAKREGG